jgi:hypothetical protein
MQFPFGPLQPDRGDLAASVIVADGVLPTLDGYGPHPSFYVSPSAQALPDAPRGVFSLVLNDASWTAFEFTASTLYQLQSDFTLVSIATGYACPVGYDWSAIHFGTKFLFTNTVDGLKSYDVQAGGAVSSIAGAGAPAYIFTCANFVVALNCLDSTGNRNIRLIKTSGFNDQTNWTGDGADYQELADGEALIAGFDLKQNTALLLQSHALVVMQFGNAGGGAQFSLQKVADGKGSVGARSCVSFDGMVFYLASDGFYRFDLANGNVPIGANEVDQTFLASVDQSQFSLVQGSVDPLHKVVRWRYKRSIDASLTVSEVAIGYDWNLKRWFTITEPTSYLTRLATVAVTYNAAQGTYDSQTLSYDDLFWSGAAPLSGGLDESYKFGVLTGPSLARTITTGVRNSPVTGKILWAEPMTNAVAPTLELGTSDRLGTAVTFQAAESLNADGLFAIEGRGKNVQFRYRVPAADAGTYDLGIDHVRGSSGGPK